MKTIKEILEIHGPIDERRIAIFIGGSVEDAASRSPEGRRSARSIGDIDRYTIASDHRLISGGDWKAFGFGPDPGVQMLMITIGDSIERDDPNIRRFMKMGHTYPQAKTLQMYALGSDALKDRILGSR
jgi:hypothetical protein